MQYSVPQFVEVEDKIIGPLTLKQFLILIVGALFGFAYWSLFQASAVFFLLMLPTAAVFAGLAFGRFNGRPVLNSFPMIVHYLTAPRRRIFKRTIPATPVISKKPEAVPDKQNTVDPKERISRLHRLAYLLDQKSEEQEKLVEKQTTQSRVPNLY